MIVPSIASNKMRVIGYPMGVPNRVSMGWDIVTVPWYSVSVMVHIVRVTLYLMAVRHYVRVLRYGVRVVAHIMGMGVYCMRVS